MKRVAVIIACACIAGACANDFDALFAGEERTKASSSSSGSSGDDDDEVGPPDGGKPTTECGSKVCEPVLSTESSKTTITANKCCTYKTACNGDEFLCETECSNGAVCGGSCEIEGICNFTVNAAKAVLGCRGSMCSLRCSSGSSCDLDCKDSDQCTVTCDKTSRCHVFRCVAPDCDFTCEGGETEVCADKSLACNGGCGK